MGEKDCPNRLRQACEHQGRDMRVKTAWSNDATQLSLAPSSSSCSFNAQCHFSRPAGSLSVLAPCLSTHTFFLFSLSQRTYPGLVGEPLDQPPEKWKLFHIIVGKSCCQGRAKPDGTGQP